MTPIDPFPGSLPDAKARLAAAQSSAAAMPLVALLGIPPAGTPPHMSAWAVGPFGGPRQVVVVPTLKPEAPPEVVERVVARVLAIGTGRCPLCGGIQELSQAIPDPERPMRGRVSWEALPVFLDVRHAPFCPATFEPSEAHWFEGLEP